MFSRLGNRLAATLWVPVETGSQGEGLSTHSGPGGCAPTLGLQAHLGVAESLDTQASWLTPVEALQQDQRGAASVGGLCPMWTELDFSPSDLSRPLCPLFHGQLLFGIRQISGPATHDKPREPRPVLPEGPVQAGWARARSGPGRVSQWGLDDPPPPPCLPGAPPRALL